MSSQASPNPFQAIPQRKLNETLVQILLECEECGKKTPPPHLEQACKTCQLKNKMYLRYYHANIPVRYWTLEIVKDFVGDPIITQKYKEITENLRQSYLDGISICLAGAHGLGKSFLATNILKRAVEKGYTALYVTLIDIVTILLDRNEDNAQARRLLLLIDFLVIDEFDARFFQTNKAADLFGKTLEDIFRTRSQNNLPIIMITNSPNIVESFTGSIKESINSLMSCVKTIPILGKDFRIHGNK